ncbi:MAG: ZIP family metal transporter [Flavobacteriaceae bacterium]
MNIILPFLSVLLGAVLVSFGLTKSQKRVRLLLAFSGAFLLSTTITALLPEIFAHADAAISYWILGGIVVQVVLENISKGAEHGHMHIHKNSKLPWVLLIGLSLHAFIEGFPIHHHAELLWAIVVHKLPIAMLFTAALWCTKSTNVIRVAALIGFALMTPLGSYLNATAGLFQPYALEITALVVGVMLHISTTILFESAENHKFNTSKILVILLGLCLGAALH